MISRKCALLGWTLLTLSSAPARATQNTAEGVAQALFEQAREEMQNGNYQAACQKLAESERVEAANGTLFNLVLCEEQVGKVASAYLHAQELLHRLGARDERRPFVERRIEVLAPRVPKLILRFSSTWPPGTRVLLDRVDIGSAGSDVPLLVDPGVHRVTLITPGRADHIDEISLVEGREFEWRGADVELAPSPLPVRANGTGATTPPPPERGATPVARETRSPHSARERASSSTDGDGPPRWLGWTAGAVGVAGVVAGVVFGALALDRKATVADICPNKVCRDYSGIEAAAQGKRFVVASVTGFALGAVGIGTGIYVLSIYRPSSVRESAQPLGVAVSYGGAF
jgi:hypothetical protein